MMEFIEFIAQGVCHRAPGRTFPGAWLCYRCASLYSSALVGVALSGRFARRAGLGAQALLCALLLIPVVLEKLLVRSWTPFDQAALRVVTGALAGMSVGLFLGARGARHVKWPSISEKVERFIWVGCVAVVAFGALVLALGSAFVLDLVAFVGVAAIAMVSTAWALALCLRAVLFVAKRPLSAPVRIGVPPLAALVLGELLLLAALPPAYRPSYHWVRALLTGAGW